VKSAFIKLAKFVKSQRDCSMIAQLGLLPSAVIVALLGGADAFAAPGTSVVRRAVVYAVEAPPPAGFVWADTDGDIEPAAPAPRMGLEPTAELGPSDMVHTICSALQSCDAPGANAGLKTLFAFTTPQGRVALAPPSVGTSGMQGGVRLEHFVATAHHPLLALMNCVSYELLGDATVIAPTMTRGGLATQHVRVEPHHDDDGATPLSKTFLLSLEQQRRPPLEGCWMLKEAMPLEQSVFQMMNKGSTEQW